MCPLSSPMMLPLSYTPFLFSLTFGQPKSHSSFRLKTLRVILIIKPTKHQMLMYFFLCARHCSEFLIHISGFKPHSLEK